MNIELHQLASCPNGQSSSLACLSLIYSSHKRLPSCPGLSPIAKMTFFMKKTVAKDADKSAKKLQLVLLLLEPKSHRFELLELVFAELEKARVADVLANVSSAKSTVLRQQQYDGVMNASANKLDAAMLLVEFCKSKDILVGLPKRLPVTECKRLAKIILCDDRVSKRVRVDTGERLSFLHCGFLMSISC